MAVVWKLQLRVTGWKRMTMYLFVGHVTDTAVVDSEENTLKILEIKGKTRVVDDEDYY